MPKCNLVNSSQTVLPVLLLSVLCASGLDLLICPLHAILLTFGYRFSISQYVPPYLFILICWRSVSSFTSLCYFYRGNQIWGSILSSSKTIWLTQSHTPCVPEPYSRINTHCPVLRQNSEFQRSFLDTSPDC